nr:hypothetical protein CFP56_20404 [Quercus suber]
MAYGVLAASNFGLEEALYSPRVMLQHMPPSCEVEAMSAHYRTLRSVKLPANTQPNRSKKMLNQVSCLSTVDADGK